MALLWLGFPLRLTPCLPAVLVPSLLDELYLDRRCNAETIQGKDYRPNRGAPRALDQGFIAARTERGGLHTLNVPQIPNPLQYLVQLVTQCDDLGP